jgi:hypothetical protein
MLFPLPVFPMKTMRIGFLLEDRERWASSEKQMGLTRSSEAL